MEHGGWESQTLLLVIPNSAACDAAINSSKKSLETLRLEKIL